MNSLTLTSVNLKRLRGRLSSNLYDSGHHGQPSYQSWWFCSWTQRWNDQNQHVLLPCVQRSVDLLLFTCLEDDWDKLMRLVEFYARDKSYLSQVNAAADIHLKLLYYSSPVRVCHKASLSRVRARRVEINLKSAVYPLCASFLTGRTRWGQSETSYTLAVLCQRDKASLSQVRRTSWN